MTHEDTDTMVAGKLPESREAVFEVTSNAVLQVIAWRLGSKAYLLTPREIADFRDEIQDVFILYLAQLELFDNALETWLVRRGLGHLTHKINGGGT